MLNINQLDIDVNFALNMHLTHLSDHTQEKLDELSDSTHDQYEANELIKAFLNCTTDSSGAVIENSIKKIIGGKHAELKLLNKRFVEFVDSKSTSHFDNNGYWDYINTKKEDKHKKHKIHFFFKRLEEVFSYTRFGDKAYSKYKLTENLKVRTCIYCNRMYALTKYKSNGTNLMNPQLDHWLPKSKYPLLQVSFFNLIPSCDICNSRIKNAKEFKDEDHVHPYDDSYDEIKFTYCFDKDLKGYKVAFLNDGIGVNKVRNTFEYMHVDDMYNAHIPELIDLIRIEEVYGKSYLDNLERAFPSLSIKKEERYKLAFGVELDPKKFHLNPLSKFKYDILKELGIIP